MLIKIKEILPGVGFSTGVAVVAVILSRFIPGDIIGATVMALLLGMALNPVLSRNKSFNPGVIFTGKMILRLGIILMGVNLNFSEVISVGGYAIFVMIFTMATAFGASLPCGKTRNSIGGIPQNIKASIPEYWYLGL